MFQSVSARSFRYVAAVPLIALLLAGCTSPAQPDASPNPTDVSTSAPTAVSTPTPTPTPTAAAPSVRVPVQCADLFSPAAASTLLGVPAIAAVDEKSAPTDIYDAARIQQGVLTCTWGGKDKTDSGYDQELSLWVDPDGASAFASNRSWFSQHIVANPTRNAFGEQSESGCDGGGGFYCFADILVNDYWVTVLYRDLDGAHKVTEATALSRLQQIARVVVPVLRAAGAPGEAWTPPTQTTNGFCEKKNNIVDVRKALTSPGLDYPSDPPDSGSEVTNLASGDGTLSYCAWYQPGDTPKGQISYAGVSILHGGAWVIPQFVADPPTQWYVGKYAVVSVPGTTGAVLACNSADCQAIVGLGGDAVTISLDDRGKARDLANIRAMVAMLSKN